MRLTRIYVAEALADRKQINLPEQASGHLTRVLRLGQGDALRVFDGNGGEYDAVIRSVGKRSTTLDIKQFYELDCESPLAVTLLQGIARGERMDLIVQKATELGVVSIQPLMSERSVLRLSGERADKKTAHWQSVAVSACEQCGGNRVPLVHPVATLAHWLRALPGGDSESTGQHPAARLLLSLREGSRPLADATPSGDAVQKVVFLSGPEGGLSAAEEDAALACGFAPVSLGARVLRAETAALTALARLV
jgi:16S rRNA (uracil1498-N3)-methyltransferase